MYVCKCLKCPKTGMNILLDRAIVVTAVVTAIAAVVETVVVVAIVMV